MRIVVHHLALFVLVLIIGSAFEQVESIYFLPTLHGPVEERLVVKCVELHFLLIVSLELLEGIYGF